MQVAPVFLAMMWRYADGSFTFGFWYLSAIALFMVASGIWGLVARDPSAFSTSTCSAKSTACQGIEIDRSRRAPVGDGGR